MAPPIKTGKAKPAAFHGRLMVDTIGGRIRMRAWPQKRGPDVPPQVRIQNERFKAAQRLAKETKGVIFNKFIDATKNTGLYPRDLFTKLCLAPPFEIEFEDGTIMRHGRPRLETVVFQGFSLNRITDYGVLSGAFREIPWQEIVLDSAGFFSAGDDTVITIPPGVAVMQFFAGYSTGSLSTQARAIYIRRLTPTPRICAMHSALDTQSDAVATGPIPVVEGERYAVSLFWTANGTITNSATFFGGVVLGAQV